MDERARILVIDDELGMREGCRRALAPLGHHVDTAPDGEEGLRKFLAAQYDLVLLDVRMPKIGGLELLGKIQAHDPNTVCIIVTGYASIDLAIQAIKLGAYNFISKPFDSDTLTLAVNQGLEKRRLSLEARRLRAVERQAEELARAKAELERLDRLKSEFILMMAHELRAPVAAIQGYMQVILQGFASVEKQRPMLQRAHDRAGELLEFIDDLLQLARIKGAAGERRPETVDVGQVLSSAEALFLPEAAQRGITLSVTADACPPVQAIPEHVRLVWNNLISNAIKYTQPGGEVRVRLFQDGQSVVGRVEDTGIGMAPEEQKHLFREFYRSERAKALQTRGTGLGLAIVRRVLDTYGATIEVQSAVGKGSAFTFRWPLGESSTH